MTHQAEADADNLIISTPLEYIDPGAKVCKDVYVIIYFDKIPPRDQITLIRPQHVD